VNDRPSADESRQRRLYYEAVDAFEPALARLVRSYERDADKRQDLLQDIHLALWRSFERFDGRCSLRTWTYRVAHNVAAAFALWHARKDGERLVSLDDTLPDASDTEQIVDQRLMMERVHALLARLHAPDRQLLLLYLEDVDAASIGEITGLSSVNVATKIHRIKKLLASWARGGQP
jgi:RNA polymerase sigma-70 factor (ECF subfamily)